MSLGAAGITGAAHVLAARAPTMRRVRIGAVAAGWLVDLGLSLLFFAVLAAIVSGGGASPEEVAQRMSGSVELLLSSLLVGLAFTGVGGYVAAAIAKQQHVLHGVAVGLLSLGLGVSSLVGGGTEQQAWITALGLLLTVPFGAAGGYYRKVTEKP